METILVTGGFGFIGSHLVNNLLNKYNIVVIDNFRIYDSVKGYNIKEIVEKEHFGKLITYNYDIRNLYELNKIFAKHKFKAVIHLAALAGVRKSFEQPLQYIETNVQGTTNILECMRQYGCKKIIFASSSSVYGNCKENKFSEDIENLKPISIYATTKLIGEELCRSYSENFNIKTVALRFFTVYGPRQRPDLAISKFSKLILNNKPIEMYGDGTSSRDYTYIDDIIYGIEKAIDYNKTKFEIINLGSGNPILLTDMIQTLEKYLEKKAIIIKKPLPKGDVDRTYCDYSKAKKLLKYTPKTSFENGIMEYVKWIKNGGMV